MMKKSLLIPIILSLSSSSFAHSSFQLPDIISLIPSVITVTDSLNFNEHWNVTANYLQGLKPSLVGDFNVNTGRVGINHNTETPKINSVVFGTEYTV